MDFFISYAGADRAWAEWVAGELEAVGRIVRLQAWDAMPGANIVAWMNSQVAAARQTIALYSLPYFRSDWCMAEATAAFNRQALLPMRVESCDVPPILSTTGYISLHGIDEETARDRLLRAIDERKVERRAKAGFPGSPRPPAPRGSVPFPGAMPDVWNVRPRPVWFVGREALLSTIYDRFRLADDRIVSQVLTGGGGFGKTQLAVEYAYRFVSRYSLVWWVDAATASSIVESLDRLADALHLPHDPDHERRACRALLLLREQPSWLVTFDNVDDRHLLAAWWPTGSSGDILITGRSRVLGEFGHVHPVGPFLPDESAELLRRRGVRLSDGEIRAATETLDHLPLAISQAAAYLASTGFSADIYLRLVETSMAGAFEDIPADYPAGLLGSVATAVDRLTSKEPAAARVLYLAAFLAPAPLPPGLLNSMIKVALPDVEPVIGAGRVLRAIESLALGQVASGTFALHRLTQAALRHQLGTAGRERYAGQAQDLLVDVLPAAADDPSAWPLFAVLTPHIETLFDHLPSAGLPPFRAAVLAVADYLTATGQYATSASLAGAAATRWATLDGAEDNRDLLASAHRRAEALRGGGRFAEAENLDRDTYQRRARLLGAEHRDSLRSADALGLDLRGLGDRPAARDWHARALATARAMLGPDDPQTLDIAANLAVDLHGLHELAPARELDEDTLTRRRTVLGASHRQTLASARNLARDLRALDQHAQARDLARQTLDTSRQVLGPDHPDTLLAASSLAVLHYALGDLAAARDLHQDCLTRSRHVVGPDHPNTLRIANSLAVDLYRLGEAQAAGDLHRETLDRYHRTLGPDHPEALHAAHNLARDLDGLGRYDEALDLSRDTLERRTRVLGPDHPETRRTEQFLQRVQNRSGTPDGTVPEAT
ncbi:toll/interleukin-1 receptor domain-containing protein [Frankia sp. AgB1.9]|uniref:FxSxx-COOH system tetratricopeptide repeat protein n=1 Tax=Frankia sp. AgB1.9 TaxID=1836968 RepID=UPI0019320095|nr:FxSxx-COOH system tetratricopeptide repeat protein [Frankia sp. AgB1.9]MBL7487975.1 toll/interleukin-1 receptor domain-containing protein [Frankia sp. AgW1.1]MBL7550418.1 toll/interleukin-1 receptor domain-containing protein [Frankia sp. AgB1.9]MBL7620889.1 toll/interleukin-1 receptor domain-containing protein [Frankia sp. AgB1.8]